MNITLGSDNSVAVSRGEKITRGQSRSKLIKVNWRSNESPPELPISNTKHIGVESLVVQVNITRPDGEYSGWQDMIKIDGEIAFYYPLQKWDTEVSGKAQCQIRWFKAGEDGDDDDTTVYSSNTASFIVDKGVIAQNLLPSLEDYTTWQAIITALQNRAVRKYNVADIPEDIIFNANGKKNAPAMYYNFVNGSLSGTLFVATNTEASTIKQTEFLLSNGDIYLRLLTFNAEEYNSNDPGTPVEAINPNEEFINISEIIDNLQTGKVDKSSIVDNLSSSDNTKVLSAKQGKVLNDKITQEILNRQTNDNLKVDKSSIVDNLSSSDNTKVLSAKQGKTLATKIDEETTARSNTDTALNGEIAIVKSKIPNEATESNKLADKGYVVSKITEMAMPISTLYGASLRLNLNTTDYKVTAQLIDQNGNNLGSSQVIDLPLESVVVSGRYNASTKKVILTLTNESEISFSVADLISGLQSEINASNKLSSNFIDDSESEKKFVSSNEKTQIAKISTLEENTQIKDLSGYGPPTILTVGKVNQKYVDENSGLMYICRTAVGGQYNWLRLGEKIEANPTAPATEDLNKLKIGTTIFNILSEYLKSATINDIGEVTLIDKNDSRLKFSTVDCITQQEFEELF